MNKLLCTIVYGSKQKQSRALSPDSWRLYKGMLPKETPFETSCKALISKVFLKFRVQIMECQKV